MLNFKKYKRFFAFGCSMTSYRWPTWADIIAQEIPESYNYGQSGGGNMFIACQVTEANIRHKFTNDDLIMIMWSGVTREDRFLNNNWLTPGNIYTQNYYDDNFLNKFVDTKGYLLRDMCLITMTTGMLDNLGIDYHMMSMAPFEHLQSSKEKEIKNDEDEVMSFFKDTLSRIKPDLLTLGCQGVWPQHPIRDPNPGGQTADYHPAPMSHMHYLNMLFPGTTWKPETYEYVMAENTKVMQAKTFADLNHKKTFPKRIGNNP